MEETKEAEIITPEKTELILTPEQKKEDADRRLKSFREEYQKLSEKYQIDINANVQPIIGFVDLKK